MSGDKDLGGEIMVMVEEYASVMRVVSVTNGGYGRLMEIRNGIIKRVKRLEELARDSENFGKDKGG